MINFGIACLFAAVMLWVFDPERTA